jgi:two-component system CheB/CheR fusion protein
LQKNFENIDSSEKKKLLNYLYDSSVEELNLLEHLVEWARIKYATDTYSPTKIDLYLYVTKVFDTLNPTASAKSIKLVSTIEPNISVFADGNMVLSMIQNIISNAIKYAPIDSQILVLATKKQNNIIVEIRDSGIGMTKETISKLFTPQMATLSNSIKENEGAGIGLLLVKSLLEKNHGQIWVKSMVGVGTSFFFTLPINNLDIKKAS